MQSKYPIPPQNPKSLLFCSDSPLTTLRAKAPWAQSSAAPSKREAMRIIVASLLQQVSSGRKTSRSTTTAGGSHQQLPCFPSGSYSLLPSAGARIPVSIVFREDLLPGCPESHWAGVQDTVGVCLGAGDSVKSSCVRFCWKGETGVLTQT